MTDSEESDQGVGILDLPVELLGIFFKKYLNGETRLNLRLVNSSTQVLLDEYIGFQVILDENDPEEKRRFLSEVVIREAVVLDLSEFKTDGKKLPVFKEIFLYPQFLQHFHLKGNLDADLFNEILRNCPVIEIFTFAANSCLVSRKPCAIDEDSEIREQWILPEINLRSHDPTLQKRYLPRARTMNICLQVSDNSLSKKLNCEATLALLRSVQSFFLQRVVLQCWLTDGFGVPQANYAAAVFLERNPTLTKFFFGILNDVTEQDTSFQNLELIDRTVLALRNAGRNSQVKKLGIGVNGANITVWKAFVQGNRNLVHISITAHIHSESFSRDWFIGCKETLEQFILRGEYYYPFDFEWIQDCRKLKEVCLHNLLPHESSHEPNLVHAKNLPLVPETVQSFILFQAAAKTNEIIEVLDRLKTLETLVLYQTGNSAGDTGVNPTCIRKILRKRSIRSLLLVRFVASSPAEAVELIDIMQVMNRLNESGNPFINVNFGEEDPEDAGDEDSEDDENEDEQPVQPNLQAIGDMLNRIVNEVEVEIQEDNVVQAPEDSTCKDAFTPETGALEAQELEKETANSNEMIINQETLLLEPNNNKDLQTPTTQAPHSNSRTDGLIDEELLGACGGAPIDSTYKSNLNFSENPEPPPFERNIEAEPSIMQPSPPNPTRRGISVDSVHHDHDYTTSGPDDSDDGEPSSSFPAADSDGEEEFPVVDHEDIFDFGLELDVEIFEQADGQQAAHQNFHLVVNLQNDGDLQDILGVLGPIAQQDNNNIFIGFVLDGVVDISGPSQSSSNNNGAASSTSSSTTWSSTINQNGVLSYGIKFNFVDE